jgi:hypothetical protein
MSWLRSIELHCGGVLIAALLLAFPASAEDMSSCAAFKWPLDKERAAFANEAMETVTSGARPGAFKEQAFAFKLLPAESVKFAVPPGGKPKPGSAASNGGVATFEAPAKAGAYQVTLSGEGWIDVVQNGTALKSAAHSGAKNCPGLRKSVRFELQAAPVVLQLSAVPEAVVKVAIRPVE